MNFRHQNMNQSIIKNLAVSLVALLSLMISFPGYSHGRSSRDYDLLFKNVALRDGVKFDLHLKVYVNESAPCVSGSRELFAIHGYAHSAATWENFSDALFSSGYSFLPMCRVIAIDLPGHGQSSVPTGDLYSDLSLEDDVSAIIAALERLPSVGLRPQSIVGHSQGGLLVQMLQQRLIDQGTNLHRAFDISRATLLAPTPPAALPWNLVDSGEATALLQNFLVADPALGNIFLFPGAVFPGLFFTNFSGEVAPGTPDIATLNSYAAPEPLISSLELTGLPPIPQRPQIEPNIFMEQGMRTALHGTALRVISFSNDGLVLSNEARQIYMYLTGDEDLRRYVDVKDEYAVHDMYISDPSALLQAASSQIQF